MTMILVDSSALVALANPQDKHHQAAASLLSQGAQTNIALVADVALTEVFYLIYRRVGYLSAVKMFTSVLRTFPIIHPTADDYQRMNAIMLHYQDARLDFVDTAIMALAERLHITQIMTFDRRDFSMMRPVHTEAFVLLP
jgi:predicted nucleic acid-binding protein